MQGPELGIGAVFGGEFRISHRIGAGGMGTVYAAQQLTTSKARALKLMHPQLCSDEGLRARFEQEARVGSLIESDHVVEVIGAGVDADTGIPWIAMELCDGEDLEEYLERRGPLSAAEALEVLRQVCHALEAAHHVGVIHRDLKPENVFVCVPQSASGSSVVKVLDFGIAKVVAEAHQSTAALGTPLWMSPEHSDPKVKVTPAADVWSLGLLAFWLLTGEVFWTAARTPGAAMQAVLRELLFDPIPPASERAAELGRASRLPADFDAWFARAVVRDPSARFADAGAAFRALGVALSGAERDAPLPPARSSGAHGRVRATLASVAPGGSISAAPQRSANAASQPSVEATSGRDGRSLAAARVGLVALSTALLASAAAAYALGYLRLGDAPAADVARATSPAPPSPVERDPPSPTAEPSAPEVAPSAEAPPSPDETIRAPTSAPRPSGGKPARGKPFDAAEAHASLGRAAGGARQGCSRLEGPRGVTVRVTFRQNGFVMRALAADPNVAGKPSVMCITSRLHSARVPAFDGDEVTVITSVTLD